MIPSSRPQLSDLYTLSQSKLLENHTFHSGTYLYSPYMAVPSPPPPPRKLAHLGQRSKDYRSWLVRGLLGERFRVRFPGVISNHCLDSWWTEGVISYMRAPSTSVFFSEMDEYQNSPRRRGWIARWSRRMITSARFLLLEFMLDT